MRKDDIVVLQVVQAARKADPIQVYIELRKQCEKATGWPTMPFMYVMPTWAWHAWAAFRGIASPPRPLTYRAVCRALARLAQQGALRAVPDAYRDGPDDITYVPA